MLEKTCAIQQDTHHHRRPEPPLRIDGAVSLIDGQWRCEIIWYLRFGPVRFNELQRCLGGIAAKTLAKQLRRMTRDGLVNRRQLQSKPPHVEYERTPLGDSLEPVVCGLMQWWSKHREDVSAARRQHDATDCC